MIEKLSVVNFTVIDRAEIEFSEGLNVITGETGAGKTVLHNALSLLAGEKTDDDAVKKGADQAQITGKFMLSQDLIDEMRSVDIDAENPVIIRRVIRRDGRNSAYINDTAVSQSILKKIGNILVDMHGQHEHQLLFKKEYHLRVLDMVSGNESDLARYRDALLKYKNSKREFDEFTRRLEEYSAESEFIEYAYNELSAIPFDDVDEDDLNSAMSEMENIEFVKETLSAVYEMVYSDEEPSLFSISAGLKNALSKISDKTKKSANILSLSQQIMTEAQELGDEALSIRDALYYDEEELARMRRLTDVIENAKRKYKMSYSELSAYRDQLRRKREALQFPQEQMDALRVKTAVDLKEAEAAALILHKKREKGSSKLESEINGYLKKFNMADTSFIVKIEFKSDMLNDDGCDDAEFFLKNQFSPEGMPLKKIASGGEVSRIMLAIKASLRKDDPVGTMVFDEIDTGISGKTAEMVADVMQALSADRQIIAVTHLPQLASKGESHILVEKSKGQITVRTIDDNERVEEIARLLGSASSKETALKHAKALLKR